MNWNLKTTQSKTTSFILKAIKSPEDFGKAINLAELGFPGMTIDFQEARNLMARALTIKLQAAEKGLIQKAIMAKVEAGEISLD